MVLSSFEPHIIGTRHLIDLALSSPLHPKFLFTSSIASAQSWDASSGPCPEDIIDDSNVAIGGYGQSKYVAERVCRSPVGNIIHLMVYSLGFSQQWFECHKCPYWSDLRCTTEGDVGYQRLGADLGQDKHISWVSSTG